MIRINYITNLDVDNYSGGWSGMNYNIYQQLSGKFHIHLLQKIDPPYILSEKIFSKAFRNAGMKGIFPAFTKRRLKQIKMQVESEIDNSCQLNFYHGVTPWLLVENKLPYAVYLDCCFWSYINVYHNSQQFSSRQLKNLFNKEADFLNNAKYVFFSSKWALQDAKTGYHLKGNNLFVAGLGGALTSHAAKTHINNPYFLFVGLDFYGKGGDKVVDAFEIVRKQNSEFKLKIVGQEPPAKYRSVANVEYAGIFDKSEAGDLRKLTELFTNAFCLVLPTTKDMTPLVIIEASAVGCPVIATNNFGIPEMIKHNETGLLLDAKLQLTQQLAIAMEEMIKNKDLRQKFIMNSPGYVRTNFTWERTGKIIGDKIIESLS